MKVCSKCGESKPLTEFYKHDQCRYGVTPSCKECIRARSRAYIEADPEAKRERDRRYYEANRERVLEQVKSYAEANSEAVKARRRSQYWQNRQREREQQAVYRQAHLEEHNAANARRRQRANAQMTVEERDASVEYRKAIVDDPCFYCGKRSEVMHDDHMTPLVRGGTDHWWNLVRACASCNLRKHAMTAEEFIARLIEEG